MSMKIPATINPYGWKARIGLIVPSTNTVNEPEFWALAPKGVTVHTARVLATGPSDRDAFVRMEQALDLATEQLATAEVDIVAYGCTTGSIVCPLATLVRTMTAKAGVPALTTAAARSAWRRSQGAKAGEKVKDYPQLSIRVPMEMKARLNALSAVTGLAQWRVIVEAIDCFVSDLPPNDRELVDGLSERLLRAAG